MFKIVSSADGRCAVLRLSGQIGTEHLGELKAQIEHFQEDHVVLDLEEVKLVDRDAVHFLALCELRNIELRYCAPYIREWIFREMAHNDEQP